MKPFEDVYSIVEESSHETAFNRGEAEALYLLLSKYDNKDINCVEIGVEFGRSTTVFAEFHKEQKISFTAIDPWIGEYGLKAREHVLAQRAKYGWEYKLIEKTSFEASHQWGSNDIELLHIDGDHEYEAVRLDINLWEPLVVQGGYILLDDFAHDGLPGVTQAAKELLFTRKDISYLGTFGQKLGVFKKL